MEYIPWFAWIIIVAIIVGGVITVTSELARGRNRATQALEENTRANARLVERLDAIDARLGSVEKTLTDIP
jgi:uncharacterized membrane protein YqgA involved in biofilm formation